MAGVVQFAGQSWQNLGTINVAADPTSPNGITVKVLLNHADGLAAADGVILRKVDATLPNLHVLDLSANPLNNRAHDDFIPQLQAAATTTTPARRAARRDSGCIRK